MKEETKNEMDLLLRRLGRRKDTPVSNVAADHLDADELSTFAENALPAGARARYTAHLAECSRCRELVVQLSSSVGVVAATDMTNVSKPSAWRTFLASLFTPMVLRYAVPALGLIVVAAIGFVVLRRNQPAQMITRVTNNEQPTPLSAAEPSATAGNVSPEAMRSPDGLVDRQAKNQPVHAAPPPNAPPVVSVETEVSRDAAAAQPKQQEQTASANEPPRPAKAAPSATPEESQKTADTEVSKKEVRGLAATAPSSDRAFRDEAQREDKGNFARVRKNKAESSEETGAPDTASIGSLHSDAVSANKRSVAGRRFQKKGGVWIDTAYDSSKDSVTLTRGSEQYRALVADEPAIKTIADELDGEIIVVWKARTYRIR